MSRIDITLTQIEILSVIAKQRSFSRAAAELGMSQSAASHAIATLERQLGVQLFERQPIGVSIPASTQALLHHAETALAAVERLKAEAGRYQGRPIHKLRIASFPSAAIRLIPKILGAARRLLPAIDPVLFQGGAAQIREWLKSGLADVAFVELPAAGLRVVASFQDDLMTVIPRHVPIARKAALTLSDLDKFPMLLSQYGCEPLIEAAYRHEGMRRRVDLELHDMATLLAMVKEGLGCTLLPRLAIPEGLTGLKAIPIRPRQARQLGIALPAVSFESPAQDAFLSAAKRVLSRIPGR